MFHRSEFFALIVLGLLGVVFSLWPHSANAASSEWFETPGGKMRLITAAEPDGREIRAALEVRLEKGWKTYWRAPGDSGIPPSFNFSRSLNVENAEVGFPTPMLFVDKYTNIVGYKTQVAFPIKVQIATPLEATELKLDIVIGICADICIPVQASLTVSEPGTGSPTFEVARILADAEQSLPRTPGAEFKITNALWLNDSPNELLISAVVPTMADRVELHVEGPDEWYLLPAKQVERQAAKIKFMLDISDIPSAAKPRETELRFTLVADGQSIEQLLIPGN